MSGIGFDTSHLHHGWCLGTIQGKYFSKDFPVENNVVLRTGSFSTSWIRGATTPPLKNILFSINSETRDFKRTKRLL